MSGRRGGLGPADLRRALGRHRVLLSCVLAAASVATGLSALAPAPAPTTPVLAAADDVPAGTRLAPDDLVEVHVPSRLAPAGAITQAGSAVGRSVAGPVRAGEVLTDVRLLGSALLPSGPEVATPVRVAEPGTAALVHAGDVVDVLAAAPDGAGAATVAHAVRVLSVPLGGDDPGEGALLVVAATRSGAARLAAAAVTGRLSVVLHGR